MNRTFVHGYYMPKEYRKSLVKDEHSTHFKLGHDQSSYFMSNKKFNELGDLSAQYRAIREQLTPKTSEMVVQNKLSSKDSPRVLSIVGSNGIRTRENSPMKEIPILESIESARILKSVNSSVDNLD